MNIKSITIQDDDGKDRVELNTRGIAFSFPLANNAAGVRKALLTLEPGTTAGTVKLVAYPDMYGTGITLIDDIGA